VTREEWRAAWNVVYNATCAFGIGDMDGLPRQNAMDLLIEAKEMVMNGLSDREAERNRDEEKRIIAAYREGRLVERDK
jgi:hypothetical protein